MSRPSVVVARGSLTGFDVLRTRYEADLHLHELDIASLAALRQATATADALVVALDRLSDEAVDHLGPTVKVIGRAGIGLDSIDLAAAAARGIAVINEPDYATEEVASHAVACLLAVQRRLHQADDAVRRGWRAAPELGAIRPLSESVLGIVGGGNIGSSVIQRLGPMVREVLVHDPALTQGPSGSHLVGSVPELLSRSDLVSLHLPLTSESRHLLDAPALALLPPGAIVVNVSRGGLVDEDALAGALHSGHLAGAALDVFESEPLQRSSPLLDAPGMLLSPHMAWYSTSAAERLAAWIVEDVAAHLHGEPPVHGRLVVPSSPPTHQQDRKRK